MCIKAKGIKVEFYESALVEDEFNKSFDVIVQNRKEDEIKDVEDKVYTRDFSRD